MITVNVNIHWPKFLPIPTSSPLPPLQKGIKMKGKKRANFRNLPIQFIWKLSCWWIKWVLRIQHSKVEDCRSSPSLMRRCHRLNTLYRRSLSWNLHNWYICNIACWCERTKTVKNNSMLIRFIVHLQHALKGIKLYGIINCSNANKPGQHQNINTEGMIMWKRKRHHLESTVTENQQHTSFLDLLSW